MTDMLEVSQELLPDPKLIDALRSDDRLAQPPGLLARLRKQQMEARSAFEKQSENLSQLYGEIGHGDYDTGYLTQMADVVREKEHAQAERLRPGMEALEQKLAIPGLQLDPEIQERFQESLEIAAGWLELYRTLRERLLKLASERLGGPSEVLRARPVEGDIDHDALSREFMARFPNISERPLPNEPSWLPIEAVINYNRLETEASGEPHFLRDRGLLESALARPRNFFGFGEETLLCSPSF